MAWDDALPAEIPQKHRPSATDSPNGLQMPPRRLQEPRCGPRPLFPVPSLLPPSSHPGPRGSLRPAERDTARNPGRSGARGFSLEPFGFYRVWAGHVVAGPGRVAGGRSGLSSPTELPPAYLGVTRPAMNW